MLFLLVAIPPALLMMLLGLISAYSARRTLVHFSLCLVWGVAGILVFTFRYDAGFGVFCLVQAAAGFFSWLAVMLRRLSEEAGGAPPPPPESPQTPATRA
jgi:hypothetical protein